MKKVILPSIKSKGQVKMKTSNFIYPLLSCTSSPGTRDTSQTLLHPSGQSFGCQTKPGPQNTEHLASCEQK
jgi:hypothetical protein